MGTAPSWMTQVRLLVKKLQHVALMRDTVEKFAVLNTEMEKIGHLRQVSKHKVHLGGADFTPALCCMY